MAPRYAQSEKFRITLVGDLMLGRLIDQLLANHVDEAEEASIVTRLRQRHPHLQDYTHVSPWGNSVSLLKTSDLVLGNLETSMTTHPTKWPDKVFNYRMHPENAACLLEAGVDYVSLANNHTLDFSEEGLFETIQTLRANDIAFAGAGETRSAADKPAVLDLFQKHESTGDRSEQATVHVYSFSDHPADWRKVEEFNHIDYTLADRDRLKTLLTAHAGTSEPVKLKIVSVHWGPNYAWSPDVSIQDMAHFLIDICDVDVVWGHSSHHIQGVEVYNGKPIIYGCGDFIDDYAVNQEYRSDLSAAWTLVLSHHENENEKERLKVQQIEVRPNRIRQFQAGLLDKADEDFSWLRSKFEELCKHLGTKIEPDLGKDGQIVINLHRQ